MTTFEMPHRRRRRCISSSKALTKREPVWENGTARAWRLKHGCCLYAPGSDQGEAYGQEGVRGMPQDGRHLGPPAAKPHLRSCRVLRFFKESACDQAFPRDQASA